ncbi:transposase [Streptococcus pneumoniae]|nr:transposase [Streptococcus pneumoniae]
MDNAIWHKSSTLKIPTNIGFTFIPPYTPEMNPAYKKELGRSYTRDAFYQLLKRHGWRNIMPRPEHPKKADAQTIVASKNKISIQEEKKAL